MRHAGVQQGKGIHKQRSRLFCKRATSPRLERKKGQQRRTQGRHKEDRSIPKLLCSRILVAFSTALLLEAKEPAQSEAGGSRGGPCLRLHRMHTQSGPAVTCRCLQMLAACRLEPVGWQDQHSHRALVVGRRSMRSQRQARWRHVRDEAVKIAASGPSRRPGEGGRRPWINADAAP